MSKPTVVERKVPSHWIPTPTAAWKIAVWYAVLGSLWILCSGWLLHHFVVSGELETALEQIKGWFFVIVTATLLGLSLDRYFREIRRSAKLLQDSEQRWQFALEGAGYGVWDWNSQTNEVFFSLRWKAMLGYEPEEVGTSISEWKTRVHPDDLPRVSQELKKHLESQTPVFSSEYRFRCKDGSYKWLLNRGKVMSRTPEGKPLRVLGTHSDITERKHLEAQLRQAQKLEAVGQLAGGVAHDFNNILAAILIQLGLMQENSNLDEETRNALNDLDSEARRAVNLTRQLLMFSRRSVMKPQPLDLNKVIENLLRMLSRLIGEQVSLKFEDQGNSPMVEADAGMLEQVLMNLVVNARDAMPKGGQISIKTSVVTLTAQQAEIHRDRQSERFVCMEVSDTGCGMDEDTLKRIFEPFFTTKEAGKGTGLGLATVHGIVAQHNGWVEVSSKVGQGTSFQVFLPATLKSTAETTQSYGTDGTK